MPEISRFYGIIIRMFYNEHNPPHFHFVFGEYKGVIYIESGIIQAKAPIKVIKKVSEWYELNKEELAKNWELAQNGETLNKIEPLK